jgi:hypothetical protein
VLIYGKWFFVQVVEVSPMIFLRSLLSGARIPDIAIHDPAFMKLAVIIALPSLVAFLAGYRIINGEILSGRMRE